VAQEKAYTAAPRSACDSGLPAPDAPGDKLFHLDPLWASPAIDAVAEDPGPRRNDNLGNELQDAHRAHGQGRAHREPVAVFAFGLAGVSLMGLPPSGGFIGKWLMLSASLDSGQWWWAVVLLLGGLLTAGYVAIVLSHAIQHDPDVPIEPLPVPKLMTLSVFALAGISLLLGLRATEPLELLEIGSPVAIPALGE
jgi:hypothetical protein